jgi:tRNA (Thr-GGU) A37 N-methylase
MPIRGRFEGDVDGWIQLDERYVPGLRDLDGFSHLIPIYHLHRSGREELEGRPCLKVHTHGIFAIRSPHRPNHLGLSIVKLQRVDGNRIYLTEADMLGGRRLLDISATPSQSIPARELNRGGWTITSRGEPSATEPSSLSRGRPRSRDDSIGRRRSALRSASWPRVARSRDQCPIGDPDRPG